MSLKSITKDESWKEKGRCCYKCLSDMKTGYLVRGVFLLRRWSCPDHSREEIYHRDDDMVRSILTSLMHGNEYKAHVVLSENGPFIQLPEPFKYVVKDGETVYIQAHIGSFNVYVPHGRDDFVLEDDERLHPVEEIRNHPDNPIFGRCLTTAIQFGEGVPIIPLPVEYSSRVKEQKDLRLSGFREYFSLSIELG